MGTEQGEKLKGWRGAIVDLSFLAGAGLTSYGAWSVYQPAGFITLGVLLLAFGARAVQR